MSSSSLLRFLLVTATFYPAVGTDEENTARMRRRVDSIWWAVALRREKGGGWNRKKRKRKKKKKKTVTRVRRNLRSRPYPPTVYTVYIYIYTIILDRRFFPNGRLLETHCYIYIYIYISTDIYHIPLHCYYIRYNVYIYSCTRITVLISFSVSLALYNRHARREKCTSYTCVYIYIFSRNYNILFFYSSPDNPSPSAIDTSPSPLRLAHRDTEISPLLSPAIVYVKSTNTRTFVLAHCPSPPDPILSRRLLKHGQSFYPNN